MDLPESMAVSIGEFSHFEPWDGMCTPYFQTGHIRF